MGRRRDGNRHERKLHHRRQRRAVGYTRSNKTSQRFAHKRERQSIRTQLAHVSYDEDCDTWYTNKDPDWDLDCAWVTNGSWDKWEHRSKPDLTAEEVRRLPDRLQHRWKEADRHKKEYSNNYSSYPYYSWEYVDYDQTLEAIKKVYFTDKIKNLAIEKPNPYFFGFVAKVPLEVYLPAYTLLDEWWRAEKDRKWIAVKMQKLGYKCFTTDRELSLPPDERDET